MSILPNKPRRHIGLRALSKQSGTIILSVRSVFPFDFFSDTLILDLNKINLVKNDFFFSKTVYTVEYADILNVVAECGPFFGNVKITTRFFTAEPLTISFLKRKDALTARHLLNGLLIAYNQGDTITVKLPEDLEKTKQYLLELGIAKEG